MIIGSITITSLDPIGNAVAGDTLIPVVNMDGVPTTQKMDVANLTSYILNQGNVANFTIQNLTIEESANLGNVANLTILGGTNGYVLQTDGDGNLSWTAQTGGGGNGSVGGANTQVQFNDAGAFAGNSGFTFNKTVGALAVTKLDTADVYHLDGVVVENSDLTHGATAALVLPANGNTTVPAQINNTYGNVQITTGITAGSLKNWVFDNTGNLSTPGNVFVNGQLVADGDIIADGNISVNGGTIFGGTPTEIVTNLAIIGVDNGNVSNNQPVVITVDDSVFNYPVRGTVVIANVNAPVAVNGTWYFEAWYDNQFALFTDDTYTVYEYGEDWPAYAGGAGDADITINSPTTDVKINSGGYETTFTNDGRLVLPTDADVGESTLQTPFNSNLVLNVDGTSWVFNTSGTLELPGDKTIQTANDYPTLLAYGSSGHGGPELDWMNSNDPANQFFDNTVLRHTMYLNDEGFYIGFNENDVVGTPSPSWLFTPDGNLTAPGNVQIGASTGNAGVIFSSNPNGGTGFYANVTNITNGSSTVVVTLADVEFPGPVQGTVRIAGVQGETEANGFWGWQAVEVDQIQLYTDSTLSTPVDGTTWSAYTSGGVATSSGYNELDIRGGNVSVTTGAGQYWSFNPDGNLVLPSNTSSINYANGSPYGGATTGNVTFNNATVQGVSGYGLQLAPTPTDTANSKYLQVRAGDNDSHIHFDSGNNGLYDIIVGDDAKFVQVSSTGNIIMNSYDGVANAYTMTFDNAGNLTFPGVLGVPDPSSTVSGTNEAGIPGVQGSQTFSAQLAYSPGIDTVQVGWTVTGNNLVGTTTVTSVVEYSPGFYEITTDTTQDAPFWYNDVYTFAGVGTISWTFNPAGSITFPTLTVDLHNGGNQTAQTLQFGDNTQQAIITGPTPPTGSGQNAQRLIIQGQRGDTTGEGGDVYLWAGDADTNGGDIKIYAGDADNVSVGYGGYVNIEGGSGFDQGGYVSMQGGQSRNGQGASASVIGGIGNTAGGTANLEGGYGSIAGGETYVIGGYGGGSGGNVNITGGGAGNGLAEYGNVNINAGASSWSFNNTGNLTFPNGSVFAGNVVTTPTSINGTVNPFVWHFNDNVVGSSTTQLEWNSLDTDQTQWYLSTDSKSKYWLFDSTTQAMGYIGDGGSGALATVTFGNSVNGGTGTVHDIQLTTSTSGNIYNKAGNSTWTFDNTGNLTLPTISTGEGTDEQAIISSQRKVIPPNRFSAAIDGATPTIVYTASPGSLSLKTTLVVQHAGFGLEMFDVSAVSAGANVIYSVSNRLNATGEADTTAVVDWADTQLAITLTVNSGATTSWVTYDSTEFGIAVD